MDLDDPELDPRLAADYDDTTSARQDFDFFAGVLADRAPTRIVDLGCGSGTFTTELALAGYAMTGVDPNPAFLAIAQAKPGGDRVTWIRGTSRDVPDSAFDAALMTSHVAQEFRSDAEWAAVLADLRRGLVPGGLLAFDTRDPAARAWETWPTEWHVRLPGGDFVDLSSVVEYVDDVARFEGTVRIGRQPGDGPGPGATWSRSSWGYRFRSPVLVRQSLEEAGFQVDAMCGGWQREPVGEGVGEIVVLATAR